MPILNFQVGTIGEAGVLPRLISFDTNDSAGVVSENGYLNSLVNSGISLTQKDIAMVTANNEAVTLYNIIYSNGNWSLTPYQSSFNEAGNYVLTGTWSFQNAVTFGSTITVNSLASAPPGSQFVVWDPVSMQFYQGGSASEFTWVAVLSAFQQVAVNTGYVDRYAPPTTFLLPTVAAFGSIFEIVGGNGAAWKLTQNAGQLVYFGNQVTSIGTAGSIASTQQGDCIRVLCISANVGFIVISSMGNLLVT